MKKKVVLSVLLCIAVACSLAVFVYILINTINYIKAYYIYKEYLLDHPDSLIAQNFYTVKQNVAKSTIFLFLSFFSLIIETILFINSINNSAILLSWIWFKSFVCEEIKEIKETIKAKKQTKKQKKVEKLKQKLENLKKE